jgi:Domain of unknown function (DUF4279)
VNRQAIPRNVYLKILSDKMTAAQISSFLGIEPDRAITKGEIAQDSISGRPAKWTMWRLAEHGSSSADISELVSALHKRISLIVPGLKELRQSGCEIVLQFALYHSSADEGGRGFTLDAPLLKSLADIGAIVDVDQYVLPDEDE